MNFIQELLLTFNFALAHFIHVIFTARAMLALQALY